jgi:hypothetical protein
MKSEFETYLTEILCQKVYIKHVFLYAVLIRLFIITSVSRSSVYSVELELGIYGFFFFAFMIIKIIRFG